MGLGPAAVALYEQLREDPALAPGATFCDLGSQDVQDNGTIVCSAKEHLEERGFRYACIDLDGRHGAQRLDLNVCCFADVQGAPFDIVTNHGTSEHCIDQANIFRLMHELTRLGGLIIHIVPSWPWRHREDCYYHYSQSLFEEIAEANGYESLRLNYFEEMDSLNILAVFRRVNGDVFKFPIQRRYRQLEQR